MLRPQADLTVFLYTEPVDMRKSIDGLATIVQQQLDLDPFSESLFVFCNRQRDKIKLLLWEKNGFILWYKRLEKHKFSYQFGGQQATICLSAGELNYLLDGINIFQQKPHERLNFSAVV